MAYYDSFAIYYCISNLQLSFLTVPLSLSLCQDLKSWRTTLKDAVPESKSQGD